LSDHFDTDGTQHDAGESQPHNPPIAADTQAEADADADAGMNVPADAAASPAEVEIAGAAQTDEPEVEENGFANLGLSEPLLRALHDKGYLRPTPIQEQAIPTVLMGRDVLGCAQQRF
jgi:hypothetical protein